MNASNHFVPSIEILCAVATLAVNLLAQSALMIAAGLLAARGLRNHGAACQSTILRVTLIAVIACPFASWALASAGISGLGVELPQAQFVTAKTPDDISRLPQAEGVDTVASPDGFAFDAAIDDPIVASLQTPMGPHVTRESSAPDGHTLQRAGMAQAPVPFAATTPASDPIQPAQRPFGGLPLIGWIYGAAVVAWTLIALLLYFRLIVANLIVWRGRARASAADTGTIAACQRLARTIDTQTPTIRISTTIQSPCLVGIIRPTILLPAAMKSVSRDVLVHELAHLRRQDCLWQLLSRLTSAALWFQPMVWLLSRRMEQTADDVADDFVVQFGSDRADYARQLIDIAERYQPEWSAASVGAGIASFKSSLAKRVVRILDTSRSLSTRTGVTALVAIMVLGATCTLAVGLLGTGSVQAAPGAQDDNATEIRASAPAGDAAATAGHVRCSGRVLDPAGQPVAGAKLYLAYYSKEPVQATLRATSNAEGRFEFDVDPRSLGKTTADVQIVAVAGGYGLDWQPPFDQSGQPHEVVLRLVPDVAIKGRITDIEGNPVAAATVQIPFIRTTPSENLDSLLQAWKRDSSPRLRLTSRDQLVTKRLTLPNIGDLQTTKTDADGRFQLNGFGKERWLNLTIRGPGIGMGFIVVLSRPREEIDPLVREGSFTPTYGTKFEYAAPPGRTMIGTVREKGSNAPLANAYVYSGGMQTTTDAEGHYRLEGLGKNDRYSVGARTDAHFSSSISADDTPGLDPLKVDFELDKGVAIQIQLRDKSTGEPLRAHLAYYAAIGNKDVEGTAFAQQPYVGSRGNTQRDGSATMVVFPGPGYLGVRAENNRYVPGYPGDPKESRPFHQIKAIPNPFDVGLFHTVLEINPQSGAPNSCRFEIELDPGGTRAGRVTGPNGKQLDDVMLAGKAAIRPWAGPGYEMLPTPEFEVVGLIPGQPRTVLFIQQEHQLAKAINVDAGKEPLAVSLEAMGSLVGQVVDASGKPRTDATVRLQLRGHSSMSGRGLTRPPLASLAHTLFGDNKMREQILHPSTKVDAMGRFRFDGLVSGLRYDVYTHVGAEFGTLRTDVACDPGKVVDVALVRFAPFSR